MSLRSPGVMMRVPGFIAFSAFGTVIAQTATSFTRRVRASPGKRTWAWSASPMSFTRGAMRSELHGTIAMGRSPSASSAARCSLRHASESPGTAHPAQPAEPGPKESVSTSPGSPFRSQIRFRMQPTVRPSERAPKPRAAMATVSASSTAVWSDGAATRTSSASSAFSMSAFTRVEWTIPISGCIPWTIRTSTSSPAWSAMATTRSMRVWSSPAARRPSASPRGTAGGMAKWAPSERSGIVWSGSRFATGLAKATRIPSRSRARTMPRQAVVMPTPRPAGATRTVVRMCLSFPFRFRPRGRSARRPRRSSAPRSSERRGPAASCRS